LFASVGIAQPPSTPIESQPLVVTPLSQSLPSGDEYRFNDFIDSSAGRRASDNAFPGFIGFVSDSFQSIEPRAVTQIFPVFGSSWISPGHIFPNGDVQAYGAGLQVALGERFSFGLNQGGYITSQFRENRDGWLNLGGFAQYMVVRDVCNQFFVTAGIRWIAPSGEAEVFQGTGPANLAPYLTLGKEFGEFHVLATTGYEFPVGGGSAPSHNYYANFHLDRRFAGWLYPLVEVNCSHTTTNVALPDGLSRGFFDFGSFETDGTMVTLAVGANAVLVQNRLEFGAVYTTPITAPRDIDFNGLVMKMILRF